MRAIRTLAILLVIVTAFAACRSGTGRTAGDQVDDATITASVKSKLVADRAANLTTVNVDTQNGVVTLKGMVETAEQRARAEQLARDARGVTRVMNNLQVTRR